jgi:hypothetical protein
MLMTVMRDADLDSPTEVVFLNAVLRTTGICPDLLTHFDA